MSILDVVCYSFDYKALSRGRKKTSELGKDLSFLTLFLAKTPISGLAVVRACTEKRSELQGKNIGPKKSDGCMDFLV